MKNKRIQYLKIFLIIVIALLYSVNGFNKSVYTISHVKYYRPDLIAKYLGCNENVAYTAYTFPEGLKDAAHLYQNMQGSGIYISCQPKSMYLKIFGY